MKKSTKIMVALMLTLLFAVCVSALCACDDPQPQQSGTLITLQAGEGGLLTDGDEKVSVLTIEAAEGDSILQAVADTKPQAKDGFTFEGWYVNGEKLDKQTVSANGATVTAKYTVNFTVLVYLQNVDGSYGEPQTSTHSGIFGESYNYVAEEEHFLIDETRYNRIGTQSLQPNDVFAVYLERELCDICYSNVTTDGSVETDEVATLRYGAQLEVKDNPFFTENGRRFAGWATSPEGELEYVADDTLTLENDTTLYAVWDEAYTDRMGGGDYIFLPQTREGVAILDRMGIEFEGTVNENGVFTVQYGQSSLTGKVSEQDRTFQYAQALAAGTYLHYNRYYQTEQRVDNETTLVLDEYGAGTLTVNGTTYVGTCYYDSSFGDYAFAVDEETSFNFITGEQDGQLYFTLQDITFGEYLQQISFDKLLSGYPGDFVLTVDGYGKAVFYQSYYKDYFYAEYSIDSEHSSQSVICLNVNVDNTVERDFLDERSDYVNTNVYLFIFDSDAVFLFENRDAKGEFTDGNGGVLTLDGYGGFTDSATYTTGDGTVTGSYFAYDSEIFGTVAEMRDNNETMHYFALSSGLRKSFETLQGKTTEYWRLITDEYLDSDLVAPILVLYEEQSGKIPADIYAEVNYDLTKIGSGFCTVTKQGETDVYTFTMEQPAEGTDADNYRTIVFIVKDLFDANQILYHTYQAYILNGTNLYDELNGTGKNDGEKIWFIDFDYNGEGAFYQTKDGNVLYGSFELGSNLNWFTDDRQYGVFRYDDGVSDAYRVIRFEISGEEGDYRFEETEFLPYRLYSTDDTYNYWFDNLCLGANGEAQFLVQDDRENELGTVKGTYSQVGTTEFGDAVYRFQPQDNNFGEYTVSAFDFIIERDYVYGWYQGMPLTHNVYHVKYTVDTYVTDDGGKIEGDGYWYRGKLTTAAGVTVEGKFYNGRGEDKGKTMLLETDEMTLIFDILADGKLSMRDGLDGDYEVLDDNSQEYQHWTLVLDGHGKLTIEDSRNYATLYEGTYSLSDEYGMLDITIDVTGAVRMSFKVLLIEGSSAYAVMVNESGRGIYVAEDTSMLYIDGLNVECYYIDSRGIGFAGDYYLFGDGHGAFNYANGSGLFVFNYDSRAKTFAKQDNSDKYGTYYANDFGSAYTLDDKISNDEDAGYWFLDDDKVTAYFINEQNGAITEKTGTLTDGVLTLAGNKYLPFSEEITLTGSVTLGGIVKKENITLKFTPNGESTFEVEAFFFNENHTDLTVEFVGWRLFLNQDWNNYSLSVDVEQGTFTVELDYDYEYNNLMGEDA